MRVFKIIYDFFCLGSFDFSFHGYFRMPCENIHKVDKLIGHLFPEDSMRMGYILKCFSFFFIVLVLTSCVRQKETIRIGLLPIPDALPFIVAKHNNFFDNQNVEVELVFFKSAQERDAAYQAKKIDCALVDPVIVLLMEKAGIEIKPIFAITGSKKSGKGRLAILSAPRDLGQKGLGLAPYCIVDYVADCLLKANPLAPSWERILIPNISLRLTMLLENQIAAAVLTDPYIDYALEGGANIVIEDTGLYEIVFAASNSIMKKYPGWFQQLSPIFDRAVELINSEPEAFKDTLVHFCSIDKKFAERVELPQFHDAHPSDTLKGQAI